MKLEKRKSRQIWQFYCPQCSVTRRLPFVPRPVSPIHLVRMGLATVFVTLVLWEWFGIKGMLSAFPIWAAFELVYRLRIRSFMACTTCGFDPYLYKSNLPGARAEIEAHWRKKFAEKGVPYPEKVTAAPRREAAPAPVNPVEVSPPQS
jgi:hypothetical protein